MIGRTDVQEAAASDGWLAHFPYNERRYFPVDGGSGAGLLAQLVALDNKRLRLAASPRHAEILLIFEPVSASLAPSVLEIYRAIPRPRRALVIGGAGSDDFPGADLRRMEALIPGAERLTTVPSIDEIERRMLGLPLMVDEAPPEPKPDAKIISLSAKDERELATELVVLSLGPIQPFTAGPLRLLLVCDGEQVVSVEIESGYAARNVAYAMMQAPRSEAAKLAGCLDPLAPVAGRLAFITALERLQRFVPEPIVIQQREAALALERAQNHLCWLVRFSRIVANDRLATIAGGLYRELSELAAAVWELPSAQWIAPQGNSIPIRVDKPQTRISQSIQAINRLRNRLARDRIFALRAAAVGLVSADRLRELGVSGPNLRASEQGAGDVLSRVLTRLDLAADDVNKVAVLPVRRSDAKRPRRDAVWSVPPGEAEGSIEGPRGQIGLSLASDGRIFTRAAWRRPTVPLLALLPEILPGQRLADAELIVASLDLAMAEADG